jgi:type IV secretion system protein VirB8
LIADYYTKVGLMSGAQEQAKYGQWISKANPQSPLNVYGESGAAVINIKSTSFLKSNIALVRYTKEVSGAMHNGITHWAATIVFEYAGTPMSERDRGINPLGFQVLEYRNDPDQPVEQSLLPSSISQQFNAPASRSLPAAAPVVPPIQ